MKLFSLILCIFLFNTTAVADRATFENAKSKGATATFRLTVVDDQGTPVADVDGSAGFWNHRTNRTDVTKSTSDENGEIILSGKSFYDGGWSLRKNGYYQTGRTHVFYRDSYDCVEETFFTRKWVPDYVSTEVLKKIRNPIPMYARHWRAPVPVCEQPIGLDLKIADWVKPYGKGKVADVYITIHLGERTTLGRTRTTATRVTFDFPGKHNGVQVCKADEWSDFQSSYHVKLGHSFQQQLILEQGKTRYDWLPRDKYLVFRVRSEFSADGELLQCYYGKIYPSFEISEMEISLNAIYFNPTPNDTNLEFASGKSLSSKDTLEDERRSNVQRP